MRRLAVPAVIVGLVAGAVSLARAAEPLRLADVLDEAERKNPQIRAARERAAAMAAVPDRVAALDDPTFSYELWNAPDSFRPDEADNNIFRLSQRLPFPGKRRLAGEAATRDAEVASRDVEAVALDVRAAVKRAYYELWSRAALQGVYARERALAARMARVAERRYGVGEGSQSDVIRAQVELTRLASRVATQGLEVDAARTELDVLLSRDPDAPLGDPEDPPSPRLPESADELVRIAIETRPELAAQAAAIARETTGVRIARRSSYPDFEVAVSRFVNPGARDGFGAMAAVTLPIAWRRKYAAAVNEASARVASAESERRRVEDRVRGDVKQAYLRVRAALLRRDLLVSTHVPQAEQSLRVAESGYETGAVDFLALVDTARTIESVHVEHVEAEAEFQRAYADLERAVGRDLPPHGTR
jgi:cobalt-zinc-cadmium efflux system outer membrane protein